MTNKVEVQKVVSVGKDSLAPWVLESFDLSKKIIWEVRTHLSKCFHGSLSVLWLLKFKDILFTLRSDNSNGFILKHVPVDMTNSNFWELNDKTLVLIWCVHHWNDFKTQVTCRLTELVMLKQNKASMLTFNCYPLTNLLYAVQRSRKSRTSRLWRVCLPNFRLVDALCLLQNFSVFFLNMSYMLLNYLIFR